MSYTSLTKFERPLQVELRTPGYLLPCAIGLHAAVALAGWLSDLEVAARVVLVLALGAHLLLFYRRHIALSAGSALHSLAWDTERGWRVRCGRGQWQAARLLSPVFVSHRLALPCFRIGRGRTCSAIVIAGRLDAGEFRRLRVRLIQSAHGRGDRTQVPGA